MSGFKKFRTENKYYFLFLVLLGLVLIDCGYFIQLKENRIREWPTASGIIRISRIEVTRSEDTTYRPYVRFGYTVGEKSHTGKNLYYGIVMGYGSRSHAEKQIKPYPAGFSASVYYNPHDPQESYLDLNSPTKLLFLFLGLIFLVLGVWLFSKAEKVLADHPFQKFFHRILWGGMGIGIFLAVGFGTENRFEHWVAAALVSIACGAVGGGTVYLGFLALKFKREIENIPTSKISTGAVGSNVEISGKVINSSNSTFLAPISKQPCSFYFAKIEEQHSDEKTKWATLVEFGSHPWFCVEDESQGLALVFHEDAELHLRWTSTVQNRISAGVDLAGFLEKIFDPQGPNQTHVSKEHFTEAVDLLISQFGKWEFLTFLKKKKWYLPNRVYRIKECAIQPEDRVYVFGFAQSGMDFARLHGAPLSPEHEQQARNDVLENSQRREEWDTNQDGVIDEREMALAMDKIAEEKGYPLKESKFSPFLSRIKMVFEKNEQGKSGFILSNKSEQGLAGSFYLETLAKLVSGGLISFNSLVGFLILFV